MRLMRSLFVSVFLLFFSSSWLFAAERVELADEDGDGRKETKYFYEGQQIVRAETDRNGDAKPDIFTEYRNGKRFASKADRDSDGTIDTWSTFNENGRLSRVASDTNKDGKPDQFKEFVKGNREFVVQENDTNFDGKIDQRKSLQWDGGKTIPIFVNNRMSRVPNPGYVTLWKEEDTNFDGVIDAYSERGKSGVSARVGQPIEATAAVPAAQQAKPAEPAGLHDNINIAEAKIKRLNERHGLA